MNAVVKQVHVVDDSVVVDDVVVADVVVVDNVVLVADDVGHNMFVVDDQAQQHMVWIAMVTGPSFEE